MKPAEHNQNAKSIEESFPKDLESSEIQNELNEIKELEEQINRNDLIYASSKYKYDFRNIPTIRSFGDGISNGKIATSEADKKQNNIMKAILQFNDKVRPRSIANKDKKERLMKV